MRTCICLLLCLLLMAACGKESVIDPVFPWPVSKVAEADSLLLRIEKEGLDSDEFISLESRRRPLIAASCSIARLHPTDGRLQARRLWLQAIELPYLDRKAYFDKLRDDRIAIDSIKYPYEYHRLLSLSLAFETNPVTLYNQSTGNIRFFTQWPDELESARNMIVAGNVMTAMGDTQKAMDYSDAALEIYTRYNSHHGMRIAMSNRTRLLTSPERDSIYKEMLKDTLLKYDPASHVLLLQNAYINSDSIPLLERAIDIYRSADVDKTNLPMVLGLRAHHYSLHGDPVKGIRLNDYPH